MENFTIEPKDIKRGVELYLHYYGPSTLNEIADNLDISGLVVMLSMHDLITERDVTIETERTVDRRSDATIPGHYYRYNGSINEM